MWRNTTARRIPRKHYDACSTAAQSGLLRVVDDHRAQVFVDVSENRAAVAVLGIRELVSHIASYLALRDYFGLARVSRDSSYYLLAPGTLRRLLESLLVGDHACERSTCSPVLFDPEPARGWHSFGKCARVLTVHDRARLAVRVVKALLRCVNSARCSAAPLHDELRAIARNQRPVLWCRGSTFGTYGAASLWATHSDAESRQLTCLWDVPETDFRAQAHLRFGLLLPLGRIEWRIGRDPLRPGIALARSYAKFVYAAPVARVLTESNMNCEPLMCTIVLAVRQRLPVAMIDAAKALAALEWLAADNRHALAAVLAQVSPHSPSGHVLRDLVGLASWSATCVDDLSDEVARTFSKADSNFRVLSRRYAGEVVISAVNTSPWSMWRWAAVIHACDVPLLGGDDGKHMVRVPFVHYKGETGDDAAPRRILVSLNSIALMAAHAPTMAFFVRHVLAHVIARATTFAPANVRDVLIAGEIACGARVLDVPASPYVDVPRGNDPVFDLVALAGDVARAVDAQPPRHESWAHFLHSTAEYGSSWLHNTLGDPNMVRTYWERLNMARFNPTWKHACVLASLLQAASSLERRVFAQLDSLNGAPERLVAYACVLLDAADGVSCADGLAIRLVAYAVRYPAGAKKAIVLGRVASKARGIAMLSTPTSLQRLLAQANSMLLILFSDAANNGTPATRDGAHAMDAAVVNGSDATAAAAATFARACADLALWQLTQDDDA